MKKTIILAAILCLSSFSLFGQRTIFIVDNQTIEDFDGSILKGKIILDYKVTTTGTGRNAISVHAISTMPRYKYATTGTMQYSVELPDSLKVPVLRLRMSADSLAMKVATLTPIYIVDNEIYDGSKPFKYPSADKIESISVLKDQAAIRQLRYGPELISKYGSDRYFVIIETKKTSSGLNSYLKTLPGAKVAEDGSITVNGQPVNRIVINGRAYSVQTPENEE